MSKCKWCGKEIERTDRSDFCSPECIADYYTIYHKAYSRMRTIARRFDFDISNNHTKIIKAKIMLFKTQKECYRCPCDANNPDRYCGSALCIHDIVHYGTCHCGLFKYKKEPIDKLLNVD